MINSTMNYNTKFNCFHLFRSLLTSILLLKLLYYDVIVMNLLCNFTMMNVVLIFILISFKIIHN